MVITEKRMICQRQNSKAEITPLLIYSSTIDLQTRSPRNHSSAGVDHQSSPSHDHRNDIRRRHGMSPICAPPPRLRLETIGSGDLS